MQGEAHHTKSLIFPGPQPEASATDVSGPRKEDLKAPLGGPRKSAPVPKNYTVSCSCSKWARRERSVGILEQIDPTTTHKCLRASASISDQEGRHCPPEGERASSLRGHDLR